MSVIYQHQCLRFYRVLRGSTRFYAVRSGVYRVRSSSTRFYAAGENPAEPRRTSTNPVEPRRTKQTLAEPFLEEDSERQYTEESDDRHYRLDHRPGCERLRHAHIQVFLHEPEATVVDVRRNERSGADRDDEQLLVDARHAAEERRHDARGGGYRHRGRSDGEPQQGSKDPA